MAAPAQQCRLAIGVFDEPEWLWRSLLALLGEGLRPDQCCLVGRAASLARIPPSDSTVEADRRRLATLYRNVAAVPGLNDGCGVSATAGPVLDCWRSLDSAQREIKSALRISTTHDAELLAQIERGAVALVVRSFSPGQQSTVARALLQQSSHGVKTYEVASPPMG